jgi:hypothetical protein
MLVVRAIFDQPRVLKKPVGIHFRPFIYQVFFVPAG